MYTPEKIIGTFLIVSGAAIVMRAGAHYGAKHLRRILAKKDIGKIEGSYKNSGKSELEKYIKRIKNCESDLTGNKAEQAKALQKNIENILEEPPDDQEKYKKVIQIQDFYPKNNAPDEKIEI